MTPSPNVSIDPRHTLTGGEFAAARAARRVGRAAARLASRSTAPRLLQVDDAAREEALLCATARETGGAR